MTYLHVYSYCIIIYYMYMYIVYVHFGTYTYIQARTLAQRHVCTSFSKTLSSFWSFFSRISTRSGGKPEGKAETEIIILYYYDIHNTTNNNNW